MSELIMAIDPGVQTGYAVGRISDKGKLLVLKSGWLPWKEFVLQLQGSVVDYDTFVYESWRLRLKESRSLVGSDMQSSQCIGCIKLVAWTRGVKLVTQEPSDKVTANAWIKAHGHELPTEPVEHSRDALRHLYYYFYKEHHDQP
jgi:hypothetical protein